MLSSALVDVLLSFAGKERSTKKETGRLHPGLLKFLLWPCLYCPAMLMPEWLGYVGVVRLKNPILNITKSVKAPTENRGREFSLWVE